MLNNLHLHLIHLKFINTLKTDSKRKIHKTAESIGNLIDNKITDILNNY